MKTIIFFVCALVAASVSLCAADKPNYDQSPFGVNYLKWHYFDRPGGIDDLRTRMRIMKDAGIYWDRDGFDYGDVHPKPDVWKWDFYDKCVALARQEGINLIGLLLGGPTPRDEAQRKAYGEYVYQVVNRYKDTVKIWEIWNEPNIPSFWKDPDVKLYTLLVKEAYTRAKQAGPTCTVIIGSTSGPGEDWFNGIYDNGGWDYCDGISIHPYAMAANPIEQGLDEELRLVRKCISKFGKPKPIWSTEVGWKGKSGDRESEEAQAVRIFQTYVIHIANGVAMDYFCMDNYEDWGFVKQDKPLQTKLAYGSIRMLTQALGSPGPVAVRGLPQDARGRRLLCVQEEGQRACADSVEQRRSDARRPAPPERWADRQRHPRPRSAHHGRTVRGRCDARDSLWRGRPQDRQGQHGLQPLPARAGREPAYQLRRWKPGPARTRTAGRRAGSSATTTKAPSRPPTTAAAAPRASRYPVRPRPPRGTQAQFPSIPTRPTRSPAGSRPKTRPAGT